LEAVRSLAQQANMERFALLAAVAADREQHAEVRAEAIVGLAAAAKQYAELLQRLADDEAALVGDEARRTLRLAGLEAVELEAKPAADNLAAWNSLLGDTGDAASGGRLFFNTVGPRCGVCHQHRGRGGRIGPDLSRIGHTSTREQIITSLLQPSREIAPHYQSWILITTDGKTHTGLRQPRPGDDGTEHYFDSAGNSFSLPSDTIEMREASGTSIMPNGLQNVVSIADLRDLVTFLTSAP
jgi:putative heme-binding domain-containing protein